MEPRTQRMNARQRARSYWESARPHCGRFLHRGLLVWGLSFYALALAMSLSLWAANGSVQPGDEA